MLSDKDKDETDFQRTRATPCAKVAQKGNALSNLVRIGTRLCMITAVSILLIFIVLVAFLPFNRCNGNQILFVVQSFW
jgi:hypothetical protein